mmetsp:Transcript_77473/g.224800  ORF Transcript_77473/g.224800 Transcript_77473/m.224800 type:complete len:183 (+) Transcript_77473:164-712(+)
MGRAVVGPVAEKEDRVAAVADLAVDDRLHKDYVLEAVAHPVAHLDAAGMLLLVALVFVVAADSFRTELALEDAVVVAHAGYEGMEHLPTAASGGLQGLVAESLVMEVAGLGRISHQVFVGDNLAVAEDIQAEVPGCQVAEIASYACQSANRFVGLAHCYCHLLQTSFQFQSSLDPRSLCFGH